MSPIRPTARAKFKLTADFDFFVKHADPYAHEQIP